MNDVNEKSLKKDISKKRRKTYVDKSKAFECSICSQEFMEFHDLKAHIDLHISEPDFFCGRCGVAFSDSREYEFHLKYHDDVTITFLCEFCKEGFPTLEDLKKHETKHKTSNDIADDKKVLCKFCEESFTTVEELKKHETVDCVAATTFSCEFCKESFTTVEELKKHETKHKTPSGITDDEAFVRKICKERLPTKKEWKRHKTKHKTPNDIADNITVVCKFCKESFPTSEELEKHEMKHEKSDDTANENTESNCSSADRYETELDNCIMMCEKCGDVWYSDYDFSCHLSLHKLSDEHNKENNDFRDSPGLCEKCGDVFDDKNEFINHVFSHVKLCEKCGGIFDTETFFSNHIPSHLCCN